MKHIYQDDDLSVPSQYWGILLISVLSLFLELLFIRWVGTEIRIFAYLQNTVLVACILGLGLGSFTSNEPIQIKQSLIRIAIFLAVMSIPWSRALLVGVSDDLASTGGLLIWHLAENLDAVQRLWSFLLALALTYGVLILLVDIFVPFGRVLGRLMNSSPAPILAYSINIFGSLMGTWVLVILSYYSQPPFTWFVLAALMLGVFVLWSTRDRKFNAFLLVCILVLSWSESFPPSLLKITWSPYQKLVVYDGAPGAPEKYIIAVNNVGYQGIHDLSASNVLANPDTYPPAGNGLGQYDLPALFHPDPQSMLVVGAGAGNDVAGALRHQVDSVTAVEIDPVIISIGQRLHPEQPYASPNVHIVNDDARSFFATTTERYDVISFGLLDSHTTTAMTNARLDHYVYTIESIAQAKKLLTENGVMVLSFEARKPYISERIRRALTDVFGHEPLVFRIPYSSYGWGGVMFVTGDMTTISNQLLENHRLDSYIKELQASYPVAFAQEAKVTTDDWPYIYLETPQIPSLYYYLIGLMVFVFARSYLKWRARRALSITSPAFWHFFFLGAAFLLLEVQNISKASVVLGNTWQVNAVIVSGILLMALLANWIVHRFPRISLGVVYFLLVGSCLALYFIDLARFGFLPYPIKALIVAGLTSLPVLFSGIVFVRSFTVAPEKSNALGANLIGALVGALFQSITFIAGIKFLLLVVSAFYLLSLFALPKPSVQSAASG